MNVVFESDNLILKAKRTLENGFSFRHHKTEKKAFLVNDGTKKDDIVIENIAKVLNR